MSLPARIRRKAGRVVRRVPGTGPAVKQVSRLLNYRQLDPAQPLSASTRRLFDGSLSDGIHGTVVFVVSDLTVLPVAGDRRRRRRESQLSRRQQSAAVELRAACGLAERLHEYGYGVQVRSLDQIAPSAVSGLTTMIVLSPRYDPSPVPGDVTCLAWAVTEPDIWIGHSRLVLFDRILAASEILRLRLSLRTDRPISVLALAATEVLTTPPARTRAVVVHSRDTTAGGIVSEAVFRALAQGKVPLVNSRLGLDDLGLTAVPSYRSTTERSKRLSRMRRDQEYARALLTELSDRVGREHTYGDRARALARLLPDLRPRAQARLVDDVRGPLVGFFPDFRSTNPYQHMLYRRLIDDGVQVVPLRDGTACSVPRDDGGSLDGYVLHVHWTSAILHVTEDPDHARQRLEDFRSRILDLKDRGGHLVWTVHNVLSHELSHLDLEVELCQLLADQADLVHVMSEQTLQATLPYFRLDPTRLTVVPHSSYLGIYPDLITRKEARELLGLYEDDIVLLTVGGIRPYRGLDRLLTIVEQQAARQPRLRLLIAGKPGDGPHVDEVIDRCTAHPQIIEKFQHLPTGELQVWHRAADLAVLPYRTILNSGAFKLAQTFDLPVVAPRSGNLTEALDPTCTIGFDPDDDESLAAAIAEGMAKAADPEWAQQAHKGARAAAQDNPPARMSADFATAIRPFLTAEVPLPSVNTTEVGTVTEPAAGPAESSGGERA